MRTKATWSAGSPRSFSSTFAHAVIDAGADVFAGHRRGFPGTPMNAEAVVAVPEWRGGEFYELRLYPISLGHGKPRTVRGRPMLAEPALAKKILDDVVRFSEPFGTRVEIQDNVGIVRAGSATSDGADK